MFLKEVADNCALAQLLKVKTKLLQTQIQLEQRETGQVT
jgi:hypothetical protein